MSNSKNDATPGKQRNDEVKKKRKHKETGSTNADSAENAEAELSKEERRERKRLKKEKREKEKGQDQNPIQKVDEAVVDTQSRASSEEEAKAARKAAKAARKAEKKARLNETREERPSNDGDAGVSDELYGEYREDSGLSKLPQSEVEEFLSTNHITISHAGSMTHLRPIMEFSQLPPSTFTGPFPFATFKNPTPIQSASWPFLLSGRDVVGVAETGSGKTLAFGVPCVRHITSQLRRSKAASRSTARAVIVSPTRELAVQIHEQIERLARSAGLEAVCVYGGVPKDAQRSALRTAQIVVATPGRLNDLIDEGSADLSRVSYVVLDEADRMLDKGFEQEIKKIISSTLPKPTSQEMSDMSEGRQTLMFTATWPQSVRELAATFMNAPVRINIGEDNPTGELRANTRIKQVVEVVEQRAKEQRMLQLIKQHQSGKNSRDRILVFCLYKKEAQRVENFIRQRGFQVAGIHGDLSQDRRTKSLESFKSGETPLLVATDVAARGLDIPNVKVVLNVTFPLTAEDYVHRIGRTGRAGAEGLAITLFTEQDKAQSGSLINILKAANQPVPESLMKFGTTVKKKQHDTYGAFFKEDTGKKAEKIKFDD